MAVVVALGSPTAELGMVGAYVSILAGLFVSYLEQEDHRKQRRQDLLRMLSIPIRLATDAEIEAASDKNLFRFTTPNVSLDPGQRLEITVELKQPDGSSLDPHVRVFQVLPDGTLLRVAFDDDSGDFKDALATFYAQANEEYVIVAGGFASTTGAYLLKVSATHRVLDDYPNFFNSARAVGGLTPIAASIEMPGDQDFLEVTAGHTGLLDITQSIVIRQPSDADIRNVLFVFDSHQRLLGFNEGVRTTFVRVNVRENDRLIIRSSLGENRTGDYRLTFSNPNPNDDLPNSFREARNASLGSSALVFDALGGAKLSGTIEVLADLDLVSFLSSVTGRYTALLRADTNSQLDPVITVFDTLRNVLVANDDIKPLATVDRNIVIPANRNSFVTFDVSQGARYYVQAAGFGIDDFHRPGGQSLPTGRYVLELATVFPDDVPDVVTEATSIMLNEFGAGGIARILNDAADLDVFEVVATKSSDLTVTLSPRTMSFTGSLSVLDDRLIQIAQSESLKQSGPLTLVVSNVIAGQKLFVRVGGSATTSDGAQGETNVNYQLTLATHESQNTVVPLVDSKRLSEKSFLFL